MADQKTISKIRDDFIADIAATHNFDEINPDDHVHIHIKNEEFVKLVYVLKRRFLVKLQEFVARAAERFFTNSIADGDKQQIVKEQVSGRSAETL